LLNFFSVSLRLPEIVRFHAWFFAKLPPALTFAYAGMLHSEHSLPVALGQWFLIVTSLSLLAAWGYVLNDLSDIRADEVVGRRNVLAPMTLGRQRLLVLSLALVGATPFLILGFTSASLVLLTAYIVATAYSVPPVRLKERMLAGVIADAAGAHGLPALFVVLIVMPAPTDFHSRIPVQMVAAVTWAFCFGLRGIIIHQLQDRESDMKSGTLTLVTCAGMERPRWFARWIVFPVEIIALLAFLACFRAQAAPLLILVSLYTGTDFLRGREWNVSLDPAPCMPRRYIIPADLYEVWIPLGMLALLSVRDAWFIVLGSIHVILFYRDVRTRVRDLGRVLAAGARHLAAARS
jgi:4-hydroxybenzoate polyprenyltransferase